MIDLDRMTGSGRPKNRSECLAAPGAGVRCQGSGARAQPPVSRCRVPVSVPAEGTPAPSASAITCLAGGASLYPPCLAPKLKRCFGLSSPSVVH